MQVSALYQKQILIMAYLVNREVECLPPNILYQMNLLGFLHNGGGGVLLLPPICSRGQAKKESSDSGKEVAVQVDSDQSQSHDGLHSLDNRVGLLLFLLHVPSKLVQMPGMIVWICRAHLMKGRVYK